MNNVVVLSPQELENMLGRSQTTEAELIVICHAIVSLLKDDGGKS